jgi:hypothetical protein
MDNPFPLLPTVGTIPPEQIVGREGEIIKLLRLLRSQSVSVEEMRRMGKTLLLQKLAYLCNSGKLPEEFAEEKFKAKYFSFQGRQNFGEVIDTLTRGLKEFKEWYQMDFPKTYNLVRSLISSPEIEIGGGKFSLNLPEYKRSWKDIFYKTLEDIADAQSKGGGKLILIFDELSIMLWEWHKEGKQEEAMELLDILRERRQALERKGIRFVYCGSIGIKVVLNAFRREFKYTGEPTNEMEEFSLNPFSEGETHFLCECFVLSGFKICDGEKSAFFQSIFIMSNGLPFYISSLFNLIQTEFDNIVSPGNLQSAYRLILHDPRHHKAFKQLVDRLEIYYPREKTEEMMAILNFLSRQEEFVSEEQIFDQVEIDDRNSLNEDLYTLLGDHYLNREFQDDKRAYKFKYQIFKTWWKVNRA